MKNFLFKPFFCSIALLLCIGALSDDALFAQSVTFYSTWIEFDKEEDGDLGMYIHYDFSVSDMLNEELKMVAFIYTSEKKWAKSYRDGYKTTNGSVCTSDTSTAIYENSRWKDFVLFIPYNAMPVAKPGVTYSYTMAVRKNGWQHRKTGRLPRV